MAGPDEPGRIVGSVDESPSAQIHNSTATDTGTNVGFKVGNVKSQPSQPAPRQVTTEPAFGGRRVRILMLAANPASTTRLALDEEARAIGEKLRLARDRDWFELITRSAVRPADLLQYLNEVGPQVVHFSGLVDDAGEIVLSAGDGEGQPVGTAALVELFRVMGKGIQVVLLNASHSVAQAQAISPYVDYVIGMRAPIGEKAAAVFAAAFYSALGFGRTVRKAFEQAVADVMLHRLSGSETPELIIREGADLSLTLSPPDGYPLGTLPRHGGIGPSGWNALTLATVDPAPVYSAVQLARFAGREWLEQKVDDFLSHRPCGYVWIEAVAGMGKTTFAAHLNSSRGYVGHFIRRGSGTARSVLRNLSAQIIQQYGLSELAADGMPTWAAEPEGFSRLLSLTAAEIGPDRRLVIVIDGLDEAERPTGALPLGLPDVLPDGVFIIGTHRTGERPGTVACPATTIEIAQDDDNRRDMATFLTSVIREPALVARLAEASVPGYRFAEQLAVRGGGNWIYVKYVLTEVEIGQRRADQLSDLPLELGDYYLAALDKWQAQPDWKSVGERFLGALAAAREPVTVSTLAGFAALEPVDAGRWGDRLVRPFLTVSSDPDPTYTISHATFSDLLNGALPTSGQPPSALRDWAAQLRVTAENAAHRIVAHYLDAFGDLPDLTRLTADPALAAMDHQYAIRHLVHHLARTGRDDALLALLTAGADGPNAWHAAHEMTGSLDFYREDLDLALHRLGGVTTAQADAGHPASALTDEIRLHLMWASLGSTTGAIPDDLLVELVESGAWTVEQGISAGKRLPDIARTATVLGRLAKHATPSASHDLLSFVEGIADPEHSVKVLVPLTSSADPGVRRRAVSLALDATAVMTNDDRQADTLRDIGPNIPPDEVRRVLDIFGSMPQPGLACVRAAAAIMPLLPDNERRRTFARRLMGMTDDLVYPSIQAEAIAHLLPFVPPEERSGRMRQALDLGRMKPASRLKSTMKQMPTYVREYLLADGPTNGYTMEFALWRVVSVIAPFLPPAEVSTLALEAAGYRESWIRGLFLESLQHHMSAADLDMLVEALDPTHDGGWDRLVPRLNDAQMARLRERIAQLPEPAAADALAVLTPRAPTAGQRRTDALYHLAELAGVADAKAQADVVAALRAPDPAPRGGPGAPPPLRVPSPDTEPPGRTGRVAASVKRRLASRAPEASLAVLATEPDEGKRAANLLVLAPVLPPEMGDRAIGVTTSIMHVLTRAYAIAGLYPYLALEYRTRAFDELSLLPGSHRLQALASVLDLLTKDQLDSSLSYAAATREDVDGAKVLILERVGPYLHDNQLDRVLGIAGELTNNLGARSRALVALAPYLPTTLLARAARLAAETDLDAVRSVSAEISDRWLRQPSDLSRVQAVECVRAAIHHGNRAGSFTAIAAIAPVIKGLGGDSVVADVITAITQVGRWWS